jgi:small GTP-binding protein
MISEESEMSASQKFSWHSMSHRFLMLTLKIVLAGDTKVGKSCILSRFVQGTFDRNMPATIGAAFLTKVVTTETGSIRLQLWDTAGQEKFRSLAPMYYRSSAVAVLVFDVTSKTSLDGLEDWAAEISEKAPQNIKLVVVGNKVDLAEDRVISTAAGQETANTLGAVHYAETSAHSGAGITELFTWIAKLDLQQDLVTESPKSTQPPDLVERNNCC